MRLAARLAIAGIALSFAAPARAADEGSGVGELVWTALNLALLLGVIVYFGRKPVRAFFADRRHRIQHELAETERLRSEVEKQLATWQRKLNGLDQERERLAQLTLEQAESERDRILADARAAAERLRRDARAVIDQELRRSRDELRAEAAELTVRLAGELLRRQTSDADRERLLDEFIQGVEQSGAGRAHGEG